MSIADDFAAYRRVVAEHMGKLEAENSALRRDVYQCPPTSENDYEGFKWRDACEELERENAALKIERNRLRVVLQDIADASGFDNIGNWARNKARDALRKEEQP